MRKDEKQGIKKIKILDKMMFILAGKKNTDFKLVISDLKNKHITVKMTNDYIDIHKTKEGRVKEYKVLGKYSKKDLFDLLSENGKLKIQKINMNDSRYAKYKILIERKESGKIIERFSTKTGSKKIEIPENILKHPEHILIIDDFKNIEKHDFEKAFLATPNLKKFKGIIFKINNDYYFVDSKISELITKSICEK